MPNKTLLIVAVILGAVAVVAVNLHIRGIKKAQTEKMVEVIRVTGPIEVGSTLKQNSESLAYTKIPESESRDLADLVRKEQVTKELMEQTVTQSLEPGMRLRWDHLRWASRPLHMALVREGYTAVALAVHPLSSYGGLVLPGDIVDVYVSGMPTKVALAAASAQPAAAAAAQPIGTPAALVPPPEEAVAESEEAELENQIFGPYQPYRVLENVAVVAVGQTTRDTMKPLGEPRGRKGFSSVTLEVPEKDLNKALRLAFSKTEVILVYRPGPPAGATD